MERIKRRPKKECYIININLMKTKRIIHADFVSLCVGACCPEIKKEKNKISLRNSQRPLAVVEFSKKEWKELKDAAKKNKI
ncbi:MAG: hypothetical protein UV67_C0014G0009 [Parcubacteria group bacterium GW2011_GWC1_43_12]|nr:MAG: hypothetical protein UV34_C0014G0009 [Parcubacteria group bacterium GW2011_GWB1_42_6]KKS91948.1 MAG: hypothetical protein UV67_C0014G0009 [Parcubacteria group bacterium GW2011_GWC1_43_12]